MRIVTRIAASLSMKQEELEAVTRVAYFDHFRDQGMPLQAVAKAIGKSVRTATLYSKESQEVRNKRRSGAMTQSIATTYRVSLTRIWVELFSGLLMDSERSAVEAQLHDLSASQLRDLTKHLASSRTDLPLAFTPECEHGYKVLLIAVPNPPKQTEGDD